MRITKDDVGRKVWDYLRQEWGKIEDVDAKDVGVRFRGSYLRIYKSDGRYMDSDGVPRLFWQEVPPIPEPPKPKRMVKKTVQAWATVDCNGDVIRVHQDKLLLDAHAKAWRRRLVELTGTIEVEE